MKKKITLISIFTVLSLLNASSQILSNGGFENWSTGPSGHLDPDGWITNNGDSVLVKQGTPRTGNHSCSLIPVSDGFGGYLGGAIYISYQGAVRPLMISGWWKGSFSATPTDGITIDITVADTSSTVSGTANITTPSFIDVPNWVYFSDSINYTNSLPVFSTNVSITLSANSPFTNGQLDDLSMTYAVGIDDIIEAHFPSAVIRPDAQGLNHILYVDLLAPQSFQMNLFNIDGKKVYSRDFNLPGGHHEFFVPTENLPKRMYLCNVTGNGIQRSMKFVK